MTIKITTNLIGIRLVDTIHFLLNQSIYLLQQVRETQCRQFSVLKLQRRT